jgi:hypothetical protein
MENFGKNKNITIISNSYCGCGGNGTHIRKPSTESSYMLKNSFITLYLQWLSESPGIGQYRDAPYRRFRAFLKDSFFLLHQFRARG